MADAASCSVCGGRDFAQQEATGDTVCTVCGSVIEESNIVSAVEFQETAGGARCVGRPAGRRLPARRAVAAAAATGRTAAAAAAGARGLPPHPT